MRQSVFTKMPPPFQASHRALCRLLRPDRLSACSAGGKRCTPWPYVAGVLLLAAGSSCLNQYQERDIDSRMDRTRTRPLPAGLRSRRALGPFPGVALHRAGLGILRDCRPLPAFLGVLAVAWYNGVYTPLKRRSRIRRGPRRARRHGPARHRMGRGRRLPGGPESCGRSLFLFFMWQVPHFWLQVLHHGKEYEQAGLAFARLTAWAGSNWAENRLRLGLRGSRFRTAASPVRHRLLAAVLFPAPACRVRPRS